MHWFPLQNHWLLLQTPHVWASQTRATRSNKGSIKTMNSNLSICFAHEFFNLTRIKAVIKNRALSRVSCQTLCQYETSILSLTSEEMLYLHRIHIREFFLVAIVSDMLLRDKVKCNFVTMFIVRSTIEIKLNGCTFSSSEEMNQQIQ